MSREYKYRMTPSQKPERSLVAAVMQRAVEDLKHGDPTAVSWFVSEELSPFSFCWCCEVLNLETDPIRQLMERYMKNVTTQQIEAVLLKVKRMRQHQKAWFRTKCKESLILAKQHETAVDADVERLLGLCLVAELTADAAARVETGQ